MKKKLAIVTTHPIQYYAPVFQLLAQRGVIDIHVFYTWGEQSLEKFDPGFGKKVVWDIPLLEGYHYTFLKNTAAKPGSHHYKGVQNPTIIAEIQAYNPDAILVYGWAWQSHWKVMRHFHGQIPILFRGDSTILNNKEGIKHLLRRVALWFVYKHVDKALYVGQNNREYYTYAGLRANQLFFAPHAVDNNRFSVDRTAEVLVLKQQLGIAATDIVLLFAGKLETIKNPMLLLQAYMRLQQSNVHLLFCGNGELENVLKAMASNNANIHFLGFQNQTQMPVLYQACDVLCLVSRSETWGLAVNEAMAAGKVVFISDRVGCAADLVVDGINGAIFNANDMASATEALHALVHKGKAQLQRMGEISKQRISEYSFENQCICIEKVCIQL